MYFIVYQGSRFFQNRRSNRVISAMETSDSSTTESKNSGIDDYDNKSRQSGSFLFVLHEFGVKTVTK